MKIIVTPGLDGLVSAAGRIIGQTLPDGAMLVDLPETGTDLPPMSAALLRDGGIIIVPNWRGSGPWYQQDAPAPAGGRQSIKTVKLSEIEGETVDRLTAIEIDAYDFNPEVVGWAMTPRPETSAEKKAREKAEADSTTAAERARIMALSVSAVQFAQAAALSGIITRDEAIAWGASGILPAVLSAAIDAIPDPDQQFAARIRAAGATTYERGSPMVIALGAALGKTAAELDALFVLAATL